MGDAGELNVLAALALTRSLIKDESKVIEAIKSFHGLAHRCQLVAQEQNVQWIDDSKGTNIGATVAAIKSIPRPIILIIGGIYKGGSLDELATAIQDRVIQVLAFGQDKQVFVDALNQHTKVDQLHNLSECVDAAYSIAEPGQAVLFSPACASFDMFANYIERGLAFQSEVNKKMQVDCGS